jgi:hypothetical protein
MPDSFWPFVEVMPQPCSACAALHAFFDLNRASSELPFEVRTNALI